MTSRCSGRGLCVGAVRQEFGFGQPSTIGSCFHPPANMAADLSCLRTVVDSGRSWIMVTSRAPDCPCFAQCADSLSPSSPLNTTTSHPQCPRHITSNHAVRRIMGNERRHLTAFQRADRVSRVTNRCSKVGEH